METKGTLIGKNITESKLNHSSIKKYKFVFQLIGTDPDLEYQRYDIIGHNEELDAFAPSSPSTIGKPDYCKYCKFCQYW